MRGVDVHAVDVLLHSRRRRPTVHEAGQPQQKANTMDYYESATSTTITRKRALRELADHGSNEVDLFDAEVKPDASGMYDAQAVLRWLGY